MLAAWASGSKIIEGDVIDGLMLLRTGADNAGIVWPVSLADSAPIAVLSSRFEPTLVDHLRAGASSDRARTSPISQRDIWRE